MQWTLHCVVQCKDIQLVWFSFLHLPLIYYMTHIEVYTALQRKVFKPQNRRFWLSILRWNRSDVAVDLVPGTARIYNCIYSIQGARAKWVVVGIGVSNEIVFCKWNCQPNLRVEQTVGVTSIQSLFVCLLWVQKSVCSMISETNKE